MSKQYTQYDQVKAFFKKHSELPDLSNIKPEFLDEMIDAAPLGSKLEKELKSFAVRWAS